MSKKRFAMAYGGNVIEDKVEKKAYQTSTFKEDIEKVVALLNEQDEDIKDFVDKIFEQSEKIGELQKENEQLKAKASSWKITCSQEMNEKADLMKQLVSLKEENEQLKRKLEYCEHERFLDGLGSSNKWFGMGGF